MVIQRLYSFFKGLPTVILGALGAILLLIMLLLVGVRLVSPNIEQYRTEVQSLISHFLDQPVSIGRISLDWHGWSPELHVSNVQLLLDRSQSDDLRSVWLSFESVNIHIGMLKSLRQRSLVSTGLSVTGLSLRIERDAEGTLSIRDLAATAQASSSVVDNSLLFGWLYRQPHIELRDITLSLYDWQWHAPIRINDLSLSLANDNDRHRLQSTLRVGSNNASMVRIIADIQGDVLRPNWTAQLFVNAEKLPLQVPLQAFSTVAFPPLSANGSDGEATALLSFRAWSTWRNGDLGPILGDASMQFAASPKEPNDALPTIIANSDFRLQHEARQWQLHCEPLSVSVAQQQWPHNRLLASLEWDDQGGFSIASSVRHIDLTGLLQNARHLLPATNITEREQQGASTAWSHSLAAIDDLDGQLEHVQFQLRKTGDKSDFSLRARVADLNIISDRAQLRSAKGVLEINPSASLFALEAAVINVPLPIQAGKLYLEDVQGTLIAISHADKVHLQSPRLAFRNGTLEGHAKVSLEWPRTTASQPSAASPYLDVSLRTHNMDYAELSGLIPTATDLSLQKWLANALPEFVSDSAFLRLRGHFSNSLNTWLKALEANITGYSERFPYALDTNRWPPIEKMHSTLQLRNGHLSLTAANARFVNTVLRELRLEIPDITADKRMVHVSYAVEDTIEPIRTSIQAMQFSHLGAMLARIELEGPLGLRMKLGIPLSGEDDDWLISSKVHLQGNHLLLPGHQNKVTALNGTLIFQHNGTTLQHVNGDIVASYLDQPLSLTINRLLHEDGVRIASEVVLDNSYLLRYGKSVDWLSINNAYLQHGLRYLKGNSRVQIALDIYRNAITKKIKTTLSLSSDLRGLALRLPQPFGKTVQQRRRTRIVSQFSADDPLRIQIDYANQLHGDLIMALDQHGISELSGRIRLGEEEIDTAHDVLNTDRGANRGIEISGQLDLVDWHQWRNFLPLSATSLTTARGTADGAPAPQRASPVLRSLALAIDKLRLGNLQFNNMRLNVSPSQQADQRWGWVMDLRGDDLSARAHLITSPAETRIEADIQQIKLLQSTFPNTSVSAHHDHSSGWHMKFKGEKLSGTVTIPPNLEQASMDIDLEHLQLTTADNEEDDGTLATTFTTAITADDSGATQGSLLPHHIPDFSASVEKLLINDRNFGKLQLDTERLLAEEHHYTLTVDNDAFLLSAKGAWKTANNGIAVSTLRGQLTSHNAGTLLARFGYDHQHLQGGTTESLFDLHWVGSPIDYGREKLEGNLKFEINHGTLRQVNRGLVARTLGLLAITALPQRLLLNFGDVFKQGLPYHEISGVALFQRGNVCMPHVTLNSDSIYFNFTGHVGLHTQTLQGTATVKPRISNNLPFIPIRLVEIITYTEILDPLFAHSYSVSGDLAKPQIKPLLVGAELTTIPSC